jgi:hypothetical protein
VTGVGKTLVLLGVLLTVVGGLFLLFGDSRFPIGRLPGDFAWRRKGVSVYVPLASSLLISLVLTILLNVFLRRR